MKSNIKNRMTTLIGNNDTMSQFEQIMELPNEQFDAIYPKFKEEITKTFNSDEVRNSIVKSLPQGGISDIDGEINSLSDFINEIKEDETISGNKKDILLTLFDLSAEALKAVASNPRETVTVKVEKTDENVILPTYANTFDAGADIYCNEEIVIAPHSTSIVKTGLKVEIPNGYMINIYPRSGLSLKTNLRVANSVGVIDAEYRAEVGVLLNNIGDEEITINKGDRIAQMIIAPAPAIKWEVVDKVSETTRGNGFGSSGK